MGAAGDDRRRGRGFLLSACLLLLVARKMWRRPWSYRAAYAASLAGALVSVTPLFVADGVFAASFCYPYEYQAAWIALTSVVPPLVWARARTADGEGIGVKWALLAAVVLLPVGFAVGFAYARWVAA